LHQFIKDETFYLERMPDDDYWEEMNNVDYKGLKLNELLRFVKNTLFYEYDFGDGWTHEILLEKFLKPDSAVKYPVCTDGAMKCPPEDVGGMGGYKRITWLGGNFDPGEFDISSVNKQLAKRNYGLPRF
jgi:hypothetical protein